MKIAEIKIGIPYFHEFEFRIAVEKRQVEIKLQW